MSYEILNKSVNRNDNKVEWKPRKTPGKMKTESAIMVLKLKIRIKLMKIKLVIIDEVIKRINGNPANRSWSIDDEK
jgi:hypothetical protein